MSEAALFRVLVSEAAALGSMGEAMLVSSADARAYAQLTDELRARARAIGHLLVEGYGPTLRTDHVAMHIRSAR